MKYIPPFLFAKIPGIFLAGSFLMQVICLPAQNFAAVDKLALNTPPGKTTSIHTLSDYLCAEQPDETHKIRAIYAWITLNVAYLDDTNEGEIWATPEHLRRQHPDQVLHNRTAVCQGFANLFCALAKAAGLPCEVATGLIKNPSGTVEVIGHAWAVARIDGVWRLFDPTWGIPAPGLDRWRIIDQYFMSDPKTFITDHLPDDPVWQLLENPISEQVFRSENDAEIMTLVGQETEDAFNFQDTLSEWISLDSTARILAAEHRILQFNGSNERVVFGLAQQYWGLFFELKNTLDSLTEQAILTEVTPPDTIWFETQLVHLQNYHDRARSLFALLESPERIEKAAKFYSPEDVAALIEKLRGDLYTAIFEFQLRKLKEDNLSASEIENLSQLAQNAYQWYTRAEQRINCRKLPYSCFDLWQNRSLMSIQLAQRQVLFVQQLTLESPSDNQLKIMDLHLKSAVAHFESVLKDCNQMSSRPPRFAFIDKRKITALEGLVSVLSTAISAEHTVLTATLESVLNAPSLPMRNASAVDQKMAALALKLAKQIADLEQNDSPLSTAFKQAALLSLHEEQFMLLFNQANLRFRMALNNYETARTENTLANQRSAIQSLGNSALTNLKKTTISLDFMEDSGKVVPEIIQQKQAKVNRLSKNIRDFLQSF